MQTTSTISQDDLTKIYEECGGDLAKVAARLEIPYSDFLQRYGVTYTPAAQYPRSTRKPPADLGKDSLRRHIVSVRHSEAPTWPRDDQRKIAEAIQAYEAGTHEMCQGRDRGWFILYLIPRKQRVGARKFFHTFGE